MPPEEVRREDALAWFEKAHKDLRYAEIDLAAEPPACEDALYHFQAACYNFVWVWGQVCAGSMSGKR